MEPKLSAAIEGKRDRYSDLHISYPENSSNESWVKFLPGDPSAFGSNEGDVYGYGSTSGGNFFFITYTDKRFNGFQTIGIFLGDNLPKEGGMILNCLEKLKDSVIGLYDKNQEDIPSNDEIRSLDVLSLLNESIIAADLCKDELHITMSSELSAPIGYRDYENRQELASFFQMANQKIYERNRVVIFKRSDFGFATSNLSKLPQKIGVGLVKSYYIRNHSTENLIMFPKKNCIRDGEQISIKHFRKDKPGYEEELRNYIIGKDILPNAESVIDISTIEPIELRRSIKLRFINRLTGRCISKDINVLSSHKYKLLNDGQIRCSFERGCSDFSIKVDSKFYELTTSNNSSINISESDFMKGIKDIYMDEKKSTIGVNVNGVDAKLEIRTKDLAKSGIRNNDRLIKRSRISYYIAIVVIALIFMGIGSTFDEPIPPFSWFVSHSNTKDAEISGTNNQLSNTLHQEIKDQTKSQEATNPLSVDDKGSSYNLTDHKNGN